MAERGRAKSQDWRPNLRVRDDLDAEDICQSMAAVWPEGAKDEVLSLLVEDQDAAEHIETAERPMWPSRKRHED